MQYNWHNVTYHRYVIHDHLIIRTNESFRDFVIGDNEQLLRKTIYCTILYRDSSEDFLENIYFSFKDVRSVFSFKLRPVQRFVQFDNGKSDSVAVPLARFRPKKLEFLIWTGDFGV